MKKRDKAKREKKPGKKGFLSFLKTCCIVLLGNAMLAFFVAAFVIPHDIIMGGTTGIGIVLEKVLSIDTAMIILTLNIVLLIFGWIVLGKKFFLTTVASSVLYPVLLAVMLRIPGIDSMTDNSLLAAIFGGCLEGVSLGILVRVGSSTGGMDVVNLVLHKWLHLPVAALFWITDIIVVGGQAIFGTPEQLLIAIVTIFCETLTMQQVMILGKSKIQVYVISEQYEELRRKLLEEVQVGVTMTMVETGLMHRQQKGIMCVTSSRKLYAVTELIQSVDPDAFITITKINEVRGHGFTLERYERDYREDKSEEK